MEARPANSVTTMTMTIKSARSDKAVAQLEQTSSAATQPTGRKTGFRLDPRTKLYLLLLSSLLLFFHVHVAIEASITALLLLPFFLSGQHKQWRTGVRLTLIYAAMLAVTTLLPVASGVAFSFIAMIVVGLRVMYPCLVAGAYTFTTTSIGEMVCALRKMHTPESIIITFMVMIRFFPTVREDYRQIRAAMTLRGIASGWLGLLRHPMRSLEYILVPLLMNSTEVTQDLTVAALTKGISLPGTHTSVVQIGLRPLDWYYMAVCTLLLCTSVGGLW